jgi:hypothetical protein
MRREAQAADMGGEEGFSGQTWDKKTTWKTQAEMGGYY